MLIPVRLSWGSWPDDYCKCSPENKPDMLKLLYCIFCVIVLCDCSLEALKFFNAEVDGILGCLTSSGLTHEPTQVAGETRSNFEANLIPGSFSF